jgi:hypothetical protein
VGQAAITRHGVLEADILFQKEENIGEYSIYLLTCTVNTYNDLALSQHYNTPTPTDINEVTGLSVDLFHYFLFGYERAINLRMHEEIS